MNPPRVADSECPQRYSWSRNTPLPQPAPAGSKPICLPGIPGVWRSVIQILRWFGNGWHVLNQNYQDTNLGRTRNELLAGTALSAVLTCLLPGILNAQQGLEAGEKVSD
jgi:hypothetical protein